MRVRWHSPARLASLEATWEQLPATPGVYIIRGPKPVRRIGGVDRRGILYVGCASRLRSRLWGFWGCNHTASGFLYQHPHIARLVLGNRVRSVSDVEHQIGRLTFSFATPIRGELLARAERALLFAYLSRFGEPPPLNLSLRRRWHSVPRSSDLRWAERGILGRE